MQLESLILWTEKYKPNDLNLINQQNICLILNNMIKYNCYFNLLFYGSPGTSKTTLAINFAKKIITSNYNLIILNASEEKGINTVRDKIKKFCTIYSSSYKIIILDEVDAFTLDAQYALRNIIEIYSTKNIFILICNYINKLIYPILSRCCCFKFKNASFDECKNIYSNIIDNEKINYIDENILKSIYNLSNGDIRNFINKIQTYNILKITNIYDDFNNFINISKTKSFLEFKKYITHILTQYDLFNFVSNFFDYLLNYNVKDTIKMNMILSLSNYETNIKNKSSEYIELMLLISEFSNFLE